MNRSQAIDVFKSALVGNKMCDKAQRDPSLWRNCKFLEGMDLKPEEELAAREFHLPLSHTQAKIFSKMEEKGMKFEGKLDQSDENNRNLVANLLQMLKAGSNGGGQELER